MHRDSADHAAKRIIKNAAYSVPNVNVSCRPSRVKASCTFRASALYDPKVFDCDCLFSEQAYQEEGRDIAKYLVMRIEKATLHGKKSIDILPLLR
jgi:hypothetical protein